MGCLTKVKPQQDWVIHCEIITTESGNQIPMYWRDKTFHHMFERIAWNQELLE